MRILMVASELWPLAKVGGLGDVVASLSRALGEAGHDVRCAIPAYGRLAVPAGASEGGRHRVSLPVPVGAFDVVVRKLEGGDLPAPVLLVEHDLYGRDGIYDDPATGSGYPDNGLRWAVLCRAVHAALGFDGWFPDVVHAHDHQAAPLMGLLRWVGPPRGAPRSPATVFTMHNLGYQGVEDPAWIPRSGLPAALYYPAGPLEFHGAVNLMKIGIEAADRLTTVSPSYAREIGSSEEQGGGLQGVVAARAERLTGILNGIDTRTWDPETDPHLAFRYSAARPANKARNRTALRDELGLAKPRKPALLVAMVTRLASQKGIDLLLPAIDALLASGIQLAVLGAGEPRYESALREAATRYGGRLALRIGFDEPLAHRIEAGADAFLMPSRYEPCGLNQMYSLRYGTVPVVRATGGLADTVVDVDEEPARANGFVFRPYETAELVAAVQRAVRTWRERERWTTLMRRGMTADFSWSRSARAYLEVYRRALDDAGVPR